MAGKTITDFNRALRVHCREDGLRVDGPMPGKEIWNSGIYSISFTIYARDGHAITRIASMVIRAHGEVFTDDLITSMIKALSEQEIEKKNASASIQSLERLKNLQTWFTRWVS